MVKAIVLTVLQNFTTNPEGNNESCTVITLLRPDTEIIERVLYEGSHASNEEDVDFVGGSDTQAIGIFRLGQEISRVSGKENV